MANNQFEERLSQLKDQYASGQRELEKLQQKENEIQVTMLKISGAVQVLEEELEKAKKSSEQ